ncbi:MAG: hypothetical protein QNK37_07395 [Acidobacteriota bacterium]|nr:hypothetical protein [Acidobacteriota bacterium]
MDHYERGSMQRAPEVVPGCQAVEKGAHLSLSLVVPKKSGVKNQLYFFDPEKSGAKNQLSFLDPEKPEQRMRSHSLRAEK